MDVQCFAASSLQSVTPACRSTWQLARGLSCWVHVLAGLIPAFFPGCPTGRHLPSATHMCHPHASHQQPCLPLPSTTQAGMSSLNDFATTYMCQSLPFGGVKHSGFDRFAGIEGLRGMCIPKVGCYACVWGCCVERWMRCQGYVQHGTCRSKACERPWKGAQSAACLQSAQQLWPPLQLYVLQSVTNQLRMPDTLPHMPAPPTKQAVAEDRWPFKTAIPPLLQASRARCLVHEIAALRRHSERIAPGSRCADARGSLDTAVLFQHPAAQAACTTWPNSACHRTLCPSILRHSTP